MEPGKIFCPNCYNQVETGLTECPRCFTRISNNLENFLLAKYKIFTLIGVFGALSIYLLTTSQKNSDNSLLLLGSLYCLTIVLILSVICIWDLLSYTFKSKSRFQDSFNQRYFWKCETSTRTYFIYCFFLCSNFRLISFYFIKSGSERNSHFCISFNCNRTLCDFSYLLSVQIFFGEIQ